MVVISNYKKVENAQKEQFLMLILTGEPEMVKSQSTGRHYFTARTTSIASTFSEEVCKSMIGKKMPGGIIKVDCEPYDYTPPNSDETIELTYTWEYHPEESSVEETVMVDTII